MLHHIKGGEEFSKGVTVDRGKEPVRQMSSPWSDWAVRLGPSGFGGKGLTELAVSVPSYVF